jgi:hypothetical protein
MIYDQLDQGKFGDLGKQQLKRNKEHRTWLSTHSTGFWVFFPWM